MSKKAISIQNISKKYLVGKQKDGSLRGTLNSLFQSNKHKTEEFYALQDVSFDVMQGDVVGIIGKNGAGKSTLLKILSQITKPSSGRIELNGRVASLLEVGTGFHPELTGRENVYLNGTILGMTRKEVTQKFDEIVAFSGVEKFIDTPVKHYSSGMYVRLAFAVAAHLEPEILIIDEVLAVGDAEFQKKCLGKMKDVAGEGRTVLFVSHDLGAVKQLCNKGVLLEKGRVKFKGSIPNTIESYMDMSNSNVFQKADCLNSGTGIKRVEFLHENNLINANDSLKIKIQFETSFKNEIHLGIAFKDKNGKKISTIVKKIESNKFEKYIEIASNTFNSGVYFIDMALFEMQGDIVDYLQDVLSFEVKDTFSELSNYMGDDIGHIKINATWI